MLLIAMMRSSSLVSFVQMACAGALAWPQQGVSITATTWNLQSSSKKSSVALPK